MFQSVWKIQFEALDSAQFNVNEVKRQILLVAAGSCQSFQQAYSKNRTINDENKIFYLRHEDSSHNPKP
jgi:hypothetical protein